MGPIQVGRFFCGATIWYCRSWYSFSMCVACSWTVSGEPKLCSALGCTGNFSGVQRLHKMLSEGCTSASGTAESSEPTLACGLYFGALGCHCKSCSSSVMVVVCLDHFSLNSYLPRCHVCFGSSSWGCFLFLHMICCWAHVLSSWRLSCILQLKAAVIYFFSLWLQR